MDRGKVIADFIDVYTHLKLELEDNIEAQRYLDTHFLNFYRRTIILYIMNNNNIETVFDQLVEPAKLISKQRLRKINPVVRREFYYLEKKDLKNFNRVISVHKTLGMASKSRAVTVPQDSSENPGRSQASDASRASMVWPS